MMAEGNGCGRLEVSHTVSGSPYYTTSHCSLSIKLVMVHTGNKKRPEGVGDHLWALAARLLYRLPLTRLVDFQVAVALPGGDVAAEFAPLRGLRFGQALEHMVAERFADQRIFFHFGHCFAERRR